MSTRATKTVWQGAKPAARSPGAFAATRRNQDNDLTVYMGAKAPPYPATCYPALYVILVTYRPIPIRIGPTWPAPTYQVDANPSRCLRANQHSFQFGCSNDSSSKNALRQKSVLSSMVHILLVDPTNAG